VAQVSHVYAWGIREEQDLRASPEPPPKTQEQLPREQQKRENPQEQGVKTEGILQEKTRKDAQKPLKNSKGCPKTFEKLEKMPKNLWIKSSWPI